MWFDYPIHHIDYSDVLSDVEAEGDKPSWMKATENRKKSAKSKANEKKIELENAINLSNFGEPVTKKQVAEYLGITERAVSDRIKSHGGYFIDKNNGNIIVEKQKELR